MSTIDKEPVKRIEKILKNFDPNFNVILLDTSARTALEAASSLKCEVGAIVKSLLFKTENTCWFSKSVFSMPSCCRGMSWLGLCRRPRDGRC